MTRNRSLCVRSRHATRLSSQAANQLEFETLEDRRVLASASFDAGTGLLEVNIVDDLQTVVSHDGQFVTLNGNSDMDPVTDGVQQVPVGEIVHIEVAGSARVNNIPQSLILEGRFDKTNVPKLTSLVVGGLNHVVFNGVYHIGHNLTLGMVNNPEFHTLTRATSTPTSQITVEGPTAVFAANGHLNLTEGHHDLQGPITLWTYSHNTETTIVNQGPLELRAVRVVGNLRLEAPQITDTTSAQVSVGGMAHLKADSILLGETVEDSLNFRKLNFKSGGTVNISDDDSIELVGASYAEEANIVAAHAINDAIRARTNISGLATFTAVHVSLGERGSDTFNVGELAVNVEGHGHIAEDSDMHLVGKNTASSLNLLAEGSITNGATSFLDVASYFGVQAAGDIDIGTHETDLFRSGTLYFGAPEGHVTIHEDDSMHILESKNIARAATLFSTGDITDSPSTHINIIDTASFTAGGDILIGDQKRDVFHAGAVTFNSDNEVMILQNSDMQVTGSSSAGLLTLASEGQISDDAGAVTNVVGTANLSGDTILFGHQGTFSSAMLVVNAIGDATVHQTGNLLLDQNSRADQLHLSADGSISNTLSASIMSIGMLDLAAASIDLGMFDGDMVQSGSLQFNSTGDTRISANDNILLASNSYARAFQLISPGNIEDEFNAEVVADQFAMVQGVDIILGEQNTDCFAVNSNNISILASGIEDVTLDTCVP